jgi:hypothetical protein
MEQQDPLQWLFGDALDQRLRYEQSDLLAGPSRLPRLLLSHQKLRLNWGNWIASYRACLRNPADAVLKVAEDLQIKCRDFDNNLLGILAEIFAVLRLADHGASDFIALLRQPHKKMPDFRCLLGGQSAAVEVKNLRQHRFAEAVMLEAYHDSTVMNGVNPRFALVMLPCNRDALGRNGEGEEEVRGLVARINQYRPQVDHTVELPGGKVVRFRLEEGGDSRDESDITLDDLHNDELLKPEFRGKIKRIAAEALEQLQSASVQDVERRIIALRWELPFYDMLRSPGIAELLRADLEPVLVAGDKPVEVLIFSDFGIECDTVRC